MKTYQADSEQYVEQGYDEPESISDIREQGVSFPDEYVEDLRGLMFLGALQEEVEYGGHTFLIRTLREGEHLRIGQLTKDYKGTNVEFQARRLYTMAAAIDMVDGVPIVQQYKSDYDAIYEKAQVIRQWYPVVIADLYARYIDLENAAVTVAESLKK